MDGMPSKSIEEGMFYASFVHAPVSDNAVCDIAVRLILDMGLFANEHTKWTARTAANKMWLAMKMFWPPKIRLRRTTSIMAGHLGFALAPPSTTAPICSPRP